MSALRGSAVTFSGLFFRAEDFLYFVVFRLSCLLFNLTINLKNNLLKLTIIKKYHFRVVTVTMLSTVNFPARADSKTSVLLLTNRKGDKYYNI